MELVKSSYDPQEVTILLKDITGLVTPLPTEEREKLIQSGVHYSEMLPLEYKPTEDYMKIYEEELERNGMKTAQSVADLGDKLFKKKGMDLVLISLARAGTPIGILLKRYLKMRYDVDIPHFSISIIRGKGLDVNALNAIIFKYKLKSKVKGFQFIDGWIGKGAIQNELRKSIYLFNSTEYFDVDPNLAALSDPSMTIPDEYCGTREDFIIPSSCLNATVSGLFSRTFRRPDIIGDMDYDGATYYGELKDEDKSIDFLNEITDCLKEIIEQKKLEMKDKEYTGLDEVKQIAKDYGVEDINKVKPGIGETTRVLLRRYPDRVLISMKDAGSSDLEGILQLCKEKNVPVEHYPLKRYKAVGIIKDVSDL